jgi:hypothetical protein
MVGDVMMELLTKMGLNLENPKDGIEQRPPSIVQYQGRQVYLHNKGSLHTENYGKTSSCLRN